MRWTLIALLVSLPSLIFAQVDPSEVTIARDKWGVPHIFAPTDAGVAYGLAYAYSEDDFESMQVPFLSINGLLSSVKGKDGALFDVFAFLVDANGVVDSLWDEEVSPAFKEVLAGYAAGVNAYARTHPKEVHRKEVFPIDAKDIRKGYVTNLSIISNVHYDVARIFQGTIIAQ